MIMSKKYLWMALLPAIFAGCEKVAETIPVTEPEPVVQTDDPWLFKDDSPSSLPATGVPHTISADFGGTRTHLSINEAETDATIVWDEGDQFKMLGIVSSSSFRYATYSTSTSGSSASFTTSGSLSDLTPPYYAIYPKYNKFSISSKLIGINIPAQQEAVAGGFQRGLAISYAVTQSMTDYLHFESQVSMVRFRMSGELVSQVKQVSIQGTSSLAGDGILVIGADGKPTFTQDRSFNGDVHSSSVTLSGNFVAGQDYFIVLAPCTQSAFQMVFADAEGHSTTKTASQFTFPRGRISDFGTIDLGSAFTDDYVDPTPIQYMTATAGAPKPVTIAVIPDGFRASEMSSYEMLAKAGIDALMNTEPFKSYKEYFNVYLLRVASNESGANVTDGNGTIITPKDCYFGSKWGEDSYSDMSANDDRIFQYVSENCPDIKNNIHTIYEVPVLMIINDQRYGGINHTWSNGKAYCMAPYTYGGGRLSWRYASKGLEAASATAVPEQTRQVTAAERAEMGLNDGNWLNTLVHEFGGHCFSRLKDEYWYDTYKSAVTSIDQHSWPVPFGLNISATYDNPLWQSLLDKRQDLMDNKDARYSRIGIYQGGDVSLFNRWRSEKISCMIDNRFYFSTWQRMLIVKRIMSLSGSTFDETSFWAKDDPTDPLRDQTSGSTYGSSPLPLREVPMLPPPVLHETP